MRTLMLVLLSLTVLCALVACTGRQDNQAEARQYSFDDTPDELVPYRDKAKLGFQSVANRLIPRLTSALSDGGPEEGIKVCSSVAQDLTAQGAAESGFKLGRTSHKLRNPSNASPSWLSAFVESSAGKPGADVRPVVFDLGDRVGVASPIVLAEMCIQCHGTQDEIDDETRNLLREFYPQDEAVGFASGDLRGWFWAELPKD